VGRLGQAIVVTDLFPELVGWIRRVECRHVYQRPLSQGRLALQALYRYLLDGVCPSPRIKIVPHLVMRSNLDLFLERLPVDMEAVDQAERRITERTPARRDSARGRDAVARPKGPARRTTA
jgi:hypothetical protein